MNEAVFYGLMYLISIVLSILTIIVFQKNKKLMDTLGKIFGMHYIKNKDEEYFKSKASYKYLKLGSLLTFYTWLFGTINLFYNFLFRLVVQYIIVSILFFIIIPLLYRIVTIFEIYIHKKK